MKRSIIQQTLSRTPWRHWLEKLRQFEEAMEMSELDIFESRLRTLETQVYDLRAQVLQTAAHGVREELHEVQQGLPQ